MLMPIVAAVKKLKTKLQCVLMFRPNHIVLEKKFHSNFAKNMKLHPKTCKLVSCLDVNTRLNLTCNQIEADS